MAATKKWTLIILVCLIAIVLFQNLQNVTITFLFWQVSISQIILLPLTLALGFGLGFWAGKKL